MPLTEQVRGANLPVKNWLKQPKKHLHETKKKYKNCHQRRMQKTSTLPHGQSKRSGEGQATTHCEWWIDCLTDWWTGVLLVYWSWCFGGNKLQWMAAVSQSACLPASGCHVDREWRKSSRKKLPKKSRKRATFSLVNIKLPHTTNRGALLVEKQFFLLLLLVQLHLPVLKITLTKHLVITVQLTIHYDGHNLPQLVSEWDTTMTSWRLGVVNNNNNSHPIRVVYLFCP